MKSYQKNFLSPVLLRRYFSTGS
uniref:Uncharacterized protein n=1 Tax=Arundo donax TaxID=35708 RepID=A0A0A9FE42_ARUDO